MNNETKTERKADRLVTCNKCGCQKPWLKCINKFKKHWCTVKCWVEWHAEHKKI
jgi:hypothetical protein